VYNKFFGFKEDPFSSTPDSTFFYPSDQHRTALDALTYAVKQRKGFVVITGPIGSGKTTVARKLLRNLDARVKTAVITNTSLSPKGILTMILEDLGVEYKDGTKDKLLIQLNHYLLDQVMEDNNVVVLVDEAQNLSPSCLEEIRMLSNLETDKEKLIQIVLLGQPELRKKLAMARLAQLRQRVAVHYHLVPLNKAETKKYVLHRLNLVRANGHGLDGLFNDECLELIYDYSQGVPRRVNILCDHALLTAFVKDSPTITKEIIEEAIREIHFQGEETTHEQIYQSA